MMRHEYNDECWLPVVGYEDWYEVSNHGRVRSWHNGKWGRSTTPRILKSGSDRYDHQSVTLRNGGTQGVNRQVHTLVMESFVGPRPKGLEVCHYDGDARNNRLDNLRYDTRLANCADQFRHETTVRGERNGQHVLTQQEVLEIVDLVDSGLFMQREIAEMYNTARSNVNNIAHGYNWQWLTGRGRVVA